MVGFDRLPFPKLRHQHLKCSNAELNLKAAARTHRVPKPIRTNGTSVITEPERAIFNILNHAQGRLSVRHIVIRRCELKVNLCCSALSQASAFRVCQASTAFHDSRFAVELDDPR